MNLLSPRPAPLRPWRGDASAWPTLHGLGGVAYGTGVPGCAGVGLPSLGGLSGHQPVDGWLGATPLRVRQTGPVQWRDDGDWLFGQIDLPDEGDLADASRAAYRAVFATLREAGRPHLVRLWNYVPRINDEADGLERYRRFNVGRQDAFLEAGRDAFAGSPAACALGKADGPLCVRFLAGNRAAVPLENPRQVPAYRYSRTWGPRSPTFSRAALVDVGAGQVALLVSGTASVVGEASLHAGDVAAQVRETCANLQALMDAAQARCAGRFALADLQAVVYVRHADQADAVRAALADCVGAATPMLANALFVQADVCRSELLVEIEGHVMAEGALR